jgi:hypothetical protein
MTPIDIGIGQQSNQIDAMEGCQDVLLLHLVKLIL